MRRLFAPVPIAVICVVTALVALLGYGLASNEPEGGEAGEPAPELELPRLSGSGTGSLEDYAGRVVVLNFWASWCEPCRVESPLLQRWHERIRHRGGTVLGVDALDEVGHARDFVAEYGLSYPMLRDGEGVTRESFGILGFPETFVIDRQGRIAAVARGPVDDRFMRERVEPLLRQSS